MPIYRRFSKCVPGDISTKLDIIELAMMAERNIASKNVLGKTLFQLINETDTKHKIKDSNKIMKPNIKCQALNVIILV